MYKLSEKLYSNPRKNIRIHVRQGKTLRKIGTDFFNSSGRPGTLSTASPLRHGGSGLYVSIVAAVLHLLFYGPMKE